jgi:hypothetical protein
MNDQQRAVFKLELKQFTGGDTLYKHTLSRGTYTEGVRHVAYELEAYWLLDYIFSVQFTAEVLEQEFQVWKLKKGDENGATLTLEDGNGNQVKSFEITFTDFPLDEITFWFVNNVLLLPSEY